MDPRLDPSIPPAPTVQRVRVAWVASPEPTDWRWGSPEEEKATDVVRESMASFQWTRKMGDDLEETQLNTNKVPQFLS